MHNAPNLSLRLEIDGHSTAPRNSWRNLLESAAATISYVVLRQRERRALADLAYNPHMLQDIGLTPEQAQRIASKPFWRP